MESKIFTHHLQEISPGVLNFGAARTALLEIKSGFWTIRSQMDVLVGTRLTNTILQQAGVNGGSSFAVSFGNPPDEIEDVHFFEICLQSYQSAGFGNFNLMEADWQTGKAVIHAQEAFEAWMMLQQGQSSAGPMCAYTSGVLVGFINIITDRRDIVCIERRCQALGDDFCEFVLRPVDTENDQSAVTFMPDPELARQLNLLELLFERMPMGIAILDSEYRIQRYNPTWADFALRYAPPSGTPLRPGVGYFDHLPGAEPTIQPLFERALAGETVRENGVRLESGNVTTYWDIVLAPLHENSRTTGILNVAVDVTEQQQLRKNLEQRVKERTQELQALLDVSATANSSLNLNERLKRTLDLIVELIRAERAGVVLADEGTGELIPHTLRPEQEIQPEDMAKMILVCQSVIDGGEALYIAPDPAEGLIEPGALLPLQIRGNRIGVLVIVGAEETSFSPAQLVLFQSIADQLSVAIENARLFERAELSAIASERNRLARDLHDAVTQTLFSASMIADVLPKIWERNEEEGYRRLEELRQLTRGALSEMRTLLVELRPAALVDTDLGDLIGHQINAFIARTRLEVKYDRIGEHNPPVDVKESFYRISQEAFNNIAKHAEATEVLVRLESHPEQVELLIQDNGIGFDSQSPNHEGLGLGIMQERARMVDAQLEILSLVHGGTGIQLAWKKSK